MKTRVFGPRNQTVNKGLRDSNLRAVAAFRANAPALTLQEVGAVGNGCTSPKRSRHVNGFPQFLLGYARL